jgi:hypothetical protein
LILPSILLLLSFHFRENLAARENQESGLRNYWDRRHSDVDDGPVPDRQLCELGHQMVSNSACKLICEALVAAINPIGVVELVCSLGNLFGMSSLTSSALCLQ